MSSHVSKRCSRHPLPALTRSLRQVRWNAILCNLPLRAFERLRGSLRAKFIVVIVSLEIALMGAVVVVMETHQRRVILEQTQLRVLALGASLAAMSHRALLNYDFIQLEQAAEKILLAILTSEDIQVERKDHHRLDVLADLVPPATNPEIVYINGASQVVSTLGGTVDGGLWADVNNAGTVVYEKTVGAFNQILIAQTTAKMQPQKTSCAERLP